MMQNIDKNEFFRQATLRICGNLEIEEALVAFLNYIHPYIPAERMCVELYDEAYGAMKCIALASLTEGKKLDLLTPISPELRQHLVEVRRSNEYHGVLIEPSENNPLSQEVLKWFDCSPINLMLQMTNTTQHVIAGIVLVPKANAAFNQEHLDLLKLLLEPMSVAVSNAVRHLEVVRLKDTLKDDNTYLQGELRKIAGGQIVGADFGLKSVIGKVSQVAQLDSPVLLLGETGTGKDVIANVIHNFSKRADGPFISVNCGAIPESLIDSELFGHEKGAFTGALAQKRGRFERASGGTIFLDEIGELPPAAQVRLLKVLQDKTIERVGGTETIELDIRVIAATNRNLEQMVKDGAFREDLWFRLNVFPVHIPPLRDRKADIPALLRHFMTLKSKEMKLHPTPSVLPGSMDVLLNYEWPGNVRELQNIVERALILNPKGPIDFGTLLQSTHHASDKKPGQASSAQDLDAVVTRHIQDVLIRTEGRIHGPGGAAEILGVNPSTLRNRMKNLGIQFGRNARP